MVLIFRSAITTQRRQAKEVKKIISKKIKASIRDRVIFIPEEFQYIPSINSPLSSNRNQQKIKEFFPYPISVRIHQLKLIQAHVLHTCYLIKRLGETKHIPGWRSDGGKH